MKKIRKNRGKLFEKHIQDSFKLEGIFCYKLRDSNGAWNEGSKSRFTTTNIADFFSFYNGNLFIIEAKSTKGKSLPFSNIRGNQIEGIKELERYKGIICTFIIEFSDIGERFIVETCKIADYMATAKRKSIPFLWIQENGHKLETMEGKKVLMQIKKEMEAVINERNKRRKEEQ